MKVLLLQDVKKLGKSGEIVGFPGGDAFAGPVPSSEKTLTAKMTIP